MTWDGATWATAHLVRYPEPVTAAQLGSVGGPESALTWFYGPNRENDNAGIEQVVRAAVWIGFGYYAGRATAETVFDEPESVVPALNTAAEAWHALLAPFQHKGEFRFCERERNAELNTAAGDLDPGGPVVVITSTGYRTDRELDISRPQALLKGLVEVRQNMATRDGLIVQQSADHPHPEMDGITFSIWRDDRAMLDFAYGAGHHRGQLDRHRDRSMFDRSAFTRLRPVRSTGLWDGAKPIG